MTVKIDSIEPNIFPEIEYLDARRAKRRSDIGVKIEGKLTPVTMRLSFEQANALAALLEPFRNTRR